jgi:hypothetical protein
MSQTIDDTRTDEQKRNTTVYVVGRDSFMSGWGCAPRTSYYVIACNGWREAESVERRMKAKPEMRDVKLYAHPPEPGEGDHVAIRPACDFTYQPKVVP